MLLKESPEPDLRPGTYYLGEHTKERKGKMGGQDNKKNSISSSSKMPGCILFYFIIFIFFFFFFFFLGLYLWHMEVPSLRVELEPLHHSHGNTRSELRLQPTLQLMATPDP